MKSLQILTAIATLSTLALAADQPGFKVINDFDSPGDPSYLNGLVEANGVLYGTSTYGGKFDSGAVFALQRPSAPGGKWTLTILHSFSPSTQDAAQPSSVAVFGPDGALYGTTPYGGSACQLGTEPGCGTVYKLQPPAATGGEWTETLLYTFSGGSDGFGGFSSPVPCPNPSICTAGALYGSNDGVFELQPPSIPGGAWTKTVLASLITGGPEGMTMSDQGVLYGVTQLGLDPLADGKVFSLSPPASPGGSWTETTLYVLHGRHEGFLPEQPPSIAEDGTIYATTAGFCPIAPCGDVWGSVFALTPPSAPGGAWTYTLLYSAGQEWVTSPAVRRGDTIYATTGRRLLRIQRNPATGTWITTTLHTFESNTVPGGPLVVDESGTIFGAAGAYPSLRYIAYSFEP
jgi:hypothetical protein